MRLLMRQAIWAAAFCSALGLQTGTASADDASSDPFAGLKAIGAEDLSEMNGRQGASYNIVTNMLTGTQSFDIDSADNNIEAGSMHSGMVGLNGSFTSARGVNNMVANTGIGANIQNGLILLINMY